MEPTNHCHPIAQWRKRRKQSRSSPCGARARWARPGYDQGEWGVGGERGKMQGEVEQKEYSVREGGKEQWKIICNET